jgi:release factor glutamine methyltransferase
VKSNLKELHLIQKSLKESGYFDISRISKEIQEYSQKEKVPLLSILKRIENNEPWEYIKGESEFHGVKFMVNKNTLIPRVETEQLVDIALNILKENGPFENVIDVGTGSGCIIIFLAKILRKKKDIKFFATDKSLKALEVAEKNSVLHKVNEKVSFLKDNLIEELGIKGDSLIIANLPYIPKKMYRNLEKSVLEYEPREALEGGKNGLKYYEELLEQIKDKFLEEYKTDLLIEIEPSTLEDLKEIIKKYYHKATIKTFKDFRNQDRFVLIHLPKGNI